VKLVDVGYVARAHGVRGMVRVGGAGSESLAELDQVFLGDSDLPRKIESAQEVAGGWLVKLFGVDDRDAAEALKGQALRARREDLPPLADDELYLDDLIGCAVVDPSGAPIGTVRKIESGAAQDLLVVARDGGRETLIPLVEPIVQSVDLDARRVVCDPPEGLLDL
jgi:16S rRNA processing protein RimM